MSHFAVLVISDNVEESLAPYNENDNFEYVQSSEEIIQILNESIADNERSETIEEILEEEDLVACRTRDEIYHAQIDEKNYAILSVNDGKEYVSDCYYKRNPNAKWDWWEEYGRFDMDEYKFNKDMEDFPTYDNDVPLKIKHIDVDATIQQIIDARRKVYKEVYNLCDCNIPKIKTWKEIFDGVDYNDETKCGICREIYHSQDGVKKFQEINEKIKDGVIKDIGYVKADDFQCTEDEYANDVTFPCFAIVYDGEWYERGECGWWGMVSNQKSEKEWLKIQMDVLKRAQKENPEMGVSLIDCHI